MAKATIKIIATSGIHKEYLDKVFTNVKIHTDITKTVIFKTEDEKVLFLNPNYQIRFGAYGVELEGYFLINESLGSAVILIKDYISDEGITLV